MRVCDILFIINTGEKLAFEFSESMLRFRIDESVFIISSIIHSFFIAASRATIFHLVGLLLFRN